MNTKSRLQGETFDFLEELPVPERGETLILCQNAAGERRLCSCAVWQAGAECAETEGTPTAHADENPADGMPTEDSRAEKNGAETQKSSAESEKEDAKAEKDSAEAPPAAPELPDAAQGELSTTSSAAEKIEFFLSLFRGRPDVYARRYYNQKTGACGYVPACANEWQRGICEKPKIPCAKCQNRSFLPLNAAVVKRHLMGKDEHFRDVAGLYPLLPGDETWLLAIDFDGGTWQKDVGAVRAVCAENGLPAAVERSRSGCGAHLWLFFAEAVPAVQARRLGAALLTAAMQRRHEMKLSSYDRLFPNQDTMPKGGFGNLIALPFQGQVQKNGNTLFVDEAFAPYADQWRYLSGLRRILPAEVEQHLRDFGGDALGTLGGMDDTGDLGETSAAQASTPAKAPWRRSARTSAQSLSAADFPPVVSLVRADRLYIAKAGLSQRAMDRVRRFGAFRNPDFYKTQAMRMPVYNKPRIIDTSEETEEYLLLGRGCEEPLCAFLDTLGVGYTAREERCAGVPLPVHFNGTLRPEQQTAAQEMLRHETGVLSATTAFGKTVVGAWLIAQRGVNTLILVHSGALLQQWKKSLEEFLVYDCDAPTESDEESPAKRGRKKKQSLVGQLGAGKNTLGGRVDIATMQSLFVRDASDTENADAAADAPQVKELVRDYGMVICDECHHVSAVSFERVLRAVRAKYVYGLTATPVRQDGHQPIIFMQCGPIRYRVDARAQLERQSFTHSVLPRLTTACIENPSERNFSEILSLLCENEVRNGLIVRDAVRAVEQGRTPILLTERTEHARLLAELLQKTCANVHLLTGEGTQKEKRERLEALRAAPDSEPLILVATGKYAGEGFDVPRLDTLLLALPIAWKGTLAQYAGRLHRSYEGKQAVEIYDYIDLYVPVLERMYQKRLHGYAELGYTVQNRAEDDEGLAQNLIFDRESYYSRFSDDVFGAHREIVLASPFVQPSGAERFLRLLAQASQQGRRPAVRLLTRPAAGETPEQRARAAQLREQLQAAGVEVIERPWLQYRFAVFDGKLAWYGDLDFLAQNSGDETQNTMRLQSVELAQQLLNFAETLTPQIGKPWKPIL